MKSFFKTFFASFFGSCVGIVILCLVPVIAIFSVIGIVSSSLSEKFATSFQTAEHMPELEENTFLVIDITRGFSDHPTFSTYNQTVLGFGNGKGCFGLLDTLRAIDDAKNNPKICGIFLTGSDCQAGYATIREIHQVLANFKSSEKPIIAYLPTPTLKDYFLAVPADKIWVHPLADIQINGLASTGVYFKDALEKAGIGIQITKVGKFKSAVEPLISGTMSEEDRLQRKMLLNANWQQIAIDIAKNRKINLPVDKSIFSAEEAVAAKLIDATKYTDEVIDELCEISGEMDTSLNSFRQITLEDYLLKQNIVQVPQLNMPISDSGNDAIAVLYAEGEIVDGQGETQEIGGERLAKMIREIREDDTIKALILRVNSPGGSVFGSEQIRRELELFSMIKPLVVSMGDVAASGGYWISTPAEKIFINEMTLSGSIGVFGVLVNLENLGKKLGIASEAVTTNALAEISTIRRPKTEQELAVIQTTVDAIYEKFIALVCESRNIDAEKMPAIAEGRVWAGTQAKSLKLADDFGGLREAVSYLRKELNDDSATLRLREYPQAANRFQGMFDLFKTPESAPFANLLASTPARDKSAVGTLEALFSSAWKKLRALNDPKNIYARLPWEFEDTK